ncbi:MAG: carboxylating.nicotinate-nucleotide diphosphorylase [Nanoarchaeota archaeon]|nr:carboxylating.nicotinate-nucleotide diphosphorylase [Nanoarchaeota archaeon]
MIPTREKRIKTAYDEDFVLDALSMKVLEKHLKEDSSIDLTSKAVLKKNKKIYGVIKAKEEGILAGLEEVKLFYAKHGIETKALKQDGDELKEGDIIAELNGKEKDFLKVERTGLNIMQRMSGIATKTKRLSDIVKPYGTRIVGTRKTLINYLDKKAIKIGGGLPHRMGLYDAILIKDNHLEAIKQEGIEDVIGTAVERAYALKERYHPKFIEIEVKNTEEAVKAAEKYKEIYATTYVSCYLQHPEPPFIIMFDNMKISEIKNAVYELKEKKLYDYVLLEASGKITEKNVWEYTTTEVDAISVGELTHSVKALDISQKIIKREA